MSVNQLDGEGSTALHHAAASNAVDSLAKLIDLGADIDATDQDGYTPLHHASFNYCYEVMESLIKYGDVRLFHFVKAVAFPTDMYVTKIKHRCSERGER